MAVLKAGSTLGSNTIFTTDDTEITSNVFTTVGGIAPTVVSGASLFRHSNGTLQYGYIKLPIPVPQGEVDGWVVAGRAGTITGTTDRISFASDTPQVATYTARSAYGQSAASSKQKVYVWGGRTTISTYPTSTGVYDRHPGVPSAGYSPVSAPQVPSGHYLSDATQSPTDAYFFGGWDFDSPFIQDTSAQYKVSFASDSSATTVGSFTVTSYGGTAWTDEDTNGYYLSGQTIPPSGILSTQHSAIVWALPYASGIDSTWISPSPRYHWAAASFNSLSAGYVAGGAGTPSPTVPNFPTTSPFSTGVTKFPFASASAQSSGNLSAGTRLSAGSSSETFGYISGGYVSGSYTDNIIKFLYSNDTTNSDVGELKSARQESAGAQQ